MCPLSIFSRWLMQRSSVVLPEPLGPIITTTCPRFTERSTPFKTVRRPKRFTICSARTISLVPAALLPFACSKLIIFAPSCLTSTNQCTTTSTFGAARTKTYHTLGPALFLFEIGFRRSVGIQAVLDPILDEAPQSRKQQVVESDHDEPFKNGEVKRPKDFGSACEFLQADHRGNRCGLKHIVEFVAQRRHNHTRRLRQHDTPHSKRIAHT